MSNILFHYDLEMSSGKPVCQKCRGELVVAKDFETTLEIRCECGQGGVGYTKNYPREYFDDIARGTSTVAIYSDEVKP